MLKDKMAQFEKISGIEGGSINKLLCVYSRFNIYIYTTTTSSIIINSATILNKTRGRTTAKLYANLFIRRLHIYRERRPILFSCSSSLTKRAMRCIVKMFTAPYTSIYDKNQRHH